jgi:hypothetical protein
MAAMRKSVIKILEFVPKGAHEEFLSEKRSTYNIFKKVTNLESQIPRGLFDNLNEARQFILDLDPR